VLKTHENDSVITLCQPFLVTGEFSERSDYFHDLTILPLT